MAAARWQAQSREATARTGGLEWILRDETLWFDVGAVLGASLLFLFFSRMPFRLWLGGMVALALLKARDVRRRWQARQCRLWVGVDGVGFEAGAQAAFIPFSELKLVCRDQTTSVLTSRCASIQLVRRDGATWFIGPQPLCHRRGQLDAVLDRIVDEIRGRARAAVAASAPEGLLPAGPSTAQRVSSLRALGRDEGRPYRGGTLDPEVLAQRIMSPRAGAVIRVEAAVALSTSRAPEGLRLDAIANPTVRDAVAVALEGDEPAQLRALQNATELDG